MEYLRWFGIDSARYNIKKDGDLIRLILDLLYTAIKNPPITHLEVEANLVAERKREEPPVIMLVREDYGKYGDRGISPVQVCYRISLSKDHDSKQKTWDEIKKILDRVTIENTQPGKLTLGSVQNAEVRYDPITETVTIYCEKCGKEITRVPIDKKQG